MGVKLSQLLARERIADPGLIAQALELQAVEGGTLDTCLFEVGFAEEYVLERAVARAAGRPNRVDPRIDVPEPTALALLSPFEAAHLRVVPFHVSDGAVD